MAKEKDAPVVPEPATAATTRPTTVPLNEFVLKPGLFCHRDPAELTDRERLKPLMNSIRIQGLLSPVEFFRGSAGEPILDQGHRRTSALRFMAEDGTPGFTATMPVPAVEVVGATPQQILIRSVAENIFRQALSLVERIRAARTLKVGGVTLDDIAAAVGVGPKQVTKDLRIAEHDWMLGHIQGDVIGHTAAADLLEAAEGANRVDELQDHLAGWVTTRKAEAGEGKKLKSLMTKALSDRWVGLLKSMDPLDDEVAAAERFQATIDADANVVTVEGKLNLMTEPLEELKRAGAKLAAAQKVVEKYLETRTAFEGNRGPQDVAREEAEHLRLLLNPFETPKEEADEA